MPIDCDQRKDRESKLNTFSDGMKVLAMIMSLLFRTIARSRCSAGSARFCSACFRAHRQHRVIWGVRRDGMLMPPATLHIAGRGLLFASILLDTVVKGTRKGTSCGDRPTAPQRRRRAYGLLSRGAGVDNTRYALHHPRPCVNHPLANALTMFSRDL